jgi:hypothetical protein
VSHPDWLPPLVHLEDFGGDWARYEEAIYRCFVEDFVDLQPHLGGKPVKLKAGAPLAGKHYTFWHLISEGPQEDEQVPDPRRCERIRWPRAMIEAADSGKILRWPTQRRGKQRLLLALPDFSYLVVLSAHRSYYVLWTAYPVERSHRQRKLQADYKRSLG